MKYGFLTNHGNELLNALYICMNIDRSLVVLDRKMPLNLKLCCSWGQKSLVSQRLKLSIMDQKTSVIVTGFGYKF